MSLTSTSGASTEILMPLVWTSVASEFLRPDVVFVDAGFHQHFSQARNHAGRTRNVIDRPVQIAQVPGQHVLIDPTGFAGPFLLGTCHLCHGRDEAEI